MDGCTNPKRWAHHMWMTREAYGHNKAARRVRDGVTEDEEGMVPDDATVAYISTLDRSREERAFELAKHDYYGFLDYKVGFDLGFLSAVGVRPREDARITDTMNLFTWFMGRRYKLVDAADHIGYEWTGRAHGSLADALATLAVQRWLEQWLVAEQIRA